MADEVILTGDDLMTGPPPPSIPKELAADVVRGVDVCSEQLRNLFQCLHANDVEPFCQDHIIQFRRCSQQRDELLRKKIDDAEITYLQKLSADQVRSRMDALKKDVDLLERRLILASSAEGMLGFELRWKIHGQLQDNKRRLKNVEAFLTQKMEGSKTKRWWFF